MMKPNKKKKKFYIYFSKNKANNKDTILGRDKPETLFGMRRSEEMRREQNEIWGFCRKWNRLRERKREAYLGYAPFWRENGKGQYQSRTRG